MSDDLVESIKSTIADRLKSYFFGGFILAVAVANWKAIYVTLFVSVREIEGNVCFPNKLDYIRSFGFNWGTQFGLPVLVAFIVPFVIHHIDHLLIEMKDRGTQTWLRRKLKRGDSDLVEGKHYNTLLQENKRLAAEVKSLDVETSQLRAKVAADKDAVAKADADSVRMEDERIGFHSEINTLTEQLKLFDTLRDNRESLLETFDKVANSLRLPEPRDHTLKLVIGLKGQLERYIPAKVQMHTTRR